MSALWPSPFDTPTRQPAGGVLRVRSTLLCATVALFRERDVFDRYAARLPAGARTGLLSAVPGVWVAANVADAHYAACEGLGFSADQAYQIGATLGVRIQGSMLQTFAKLATSLGATPWVAIDRFDKLWHRMFDGGVTSVEKVGPRDALLTLEGVQFARYTYFRHSFRGANEAGARLLGPTVVVREMHGRATDTSFTLRVTW